jgi:serine/threonine protein kinase/WD40 repeat protein
MDDDSLDDRIVDRLVAHQELHDAGLTMGDEQAHVSSSIADNDLPPEQAERLARAKLCIDLLAAVGSQPESRAERSHIGSETTPFPRPRQLGRFEILDELGSGGFGIVYRAWDPRTERHVAIKVPKIEAMLSKELQARFEQEARAAAKLDHPHIVAVLEAGLDGMLPFIVSQFCPGMTLSDWLHKKTGPASPREAAEIVRSLAEAVAHAHERGVMHRDIKPGNVLMVAARHSADERQPEAMIPKLVDFGLAKLADAEQNMTQTGTLLGTIRYMAPEMAAGARKQAGPSADIYSLGAVLYELLAGVPPFANASDLEVLRNISTHEPSRVRAMRPKVPVDLETICLKCLEKNPVRRYPSAQALADDLQRFLDGRPIKARRVTSIEVVGKWARRRPAVAALLTVSLLSIVGALVGVSIYNVHLRDSAAQIEATNLQLREMTEQAQISERQAKANERQAKDLLYVADMQLAQQAWDQNNIATLEETLGRHEPKNGEPDRRGVEWYYLANKLKDDSLVLKLKGGVANCVRFSPDGNLIATTSHDGFLQLWDAATGELRATMAEPQRAELNGACFSPDGKILAVASNRRRVLLYDVEQGSLIAMLEGGHNKWVADVDFSPAGDVLASVGADGQIILWDWQRREKRKSIVAYDKELRAIRFIADGRLAVVAEEWGAPRIWDLESDRVVSSLSMKTPREGDSKIWPRTLALSHDRNRLAVAHVNGGFRLWDISNPSDPQLIKAHDDGSCRAVDFIDSDRIAVGYDDQLVQVWSLHTDQPPRLLRGHQLQLTCGSCSPDGKLIAAGSRDGTVRIWSTEPRDEGKVIAHVPGPFERLAIAPLGDEIALAFKKPAAVICIHPQTGISTRPALTAVEGSPYAMAYSRTGKYLAVATVNGFVHIFEAGQSTPLWSTVCSTLEAKPVLRFSPVEDLLVVLADQRVLAIDVPNRHIHWQHQFKIGLWSLSFRPDGSLLYVGDHLGGITEFRRADGVIKRKFEEHRNPAEGLAISPDGKHLVSTSPDRKLLLWDLPAGQVLRHLPTTEKKTTNPGFTSDGRTIIATENDCTLTFWNVGTGQRVLHLGPWGDGHVLSWQLSADNQACYFADAQVKVDSPSITVRALSFPHAASKSHAISEPSNDESANLPSADRRVIASDPK